ncbi:MAG: ferric reductase-like transmembrane domain-containing protein [Candidatus Sungbacteria bacterium]|uniref:Ferric reductase-like transmembrane domain-containing protein n=1 Tax=Candidatus Sungiibacteriota bacterium TaxID=2750080 RepID=A0A9D6QTU6_9BACT|nr:ferric reductase-like transmembrane domain-containing protein [Candidatus Sungbacteria bacterium]
MNFALSYIRYIVLTGSIILAAVLFLSLVSGSSLPASSYLKLDRLYGLIAVSFLYLALLATPLTQAWPTIPYRVVYVKARRAIGVSAFFFGLLHALISFFVLLGGYSGLFFLNSTSALAIALGFLQLLILAILASTSFDSMVRKLGTRWKQLHRLVYIAAFSILIHAIILGSDIGDWSNSISQVFYIAVIFLFALEDLRIFGYLKRKFPTFSRRLLLAPCILVYLVFSILLYRFMSFGHAH